MFMTWIRVHIFPSPIYLKTSDRGFINFFQETYPQSPPVWFSESEDAKVSEAVSILASTSGLDNHLLYQV